MFPLNTTPQTSLAMGVDLRACTITGQSIPQRVSTQHHSPDIPRNGGGSKSLRNYRPKHSSTCFHSKPLLGGSKSLHNYWPKYSSTCFDSTPLPRHPSQWGGSKSLHNYWPKHSSTCFHSTPLPRHPSQWGWI